MASLVLLSRLVSLYPLYLSLQAKKKQREKRFGRDEAKVSVRIPKSGSKQGRPLQECEVWFVCGGRVFLT